ATRCQARRAALGTARQPRARASSLVPRRAISCKVARRAWCSLPSGGQTELPAPERSLTMSFSVKDKVALVTGANRGIGKSIVETLLKNGASKVYAAVRNPDSAADLVRASGGRAVAVELDLARPATIAAAAKTAKDVQLVVNNAGVLKTASPLAAGA